MTTEKEQLKNANGWLLAMTIICVVLLILLLFSLSTDFKQKLENQDLRDQIEQFKTKQYESGQELESGA